MSMSPCANLTSHLMCMMRGKFSKCLYFVQFELFRAYYTNFFGCELWLLTTTAQPIRHGGTDLSAAWSREILPCPYTQLFDCLPICF